ncbi:histidine phosphatase family protein [Ferrovibrio sp.]|uniref:histidine phosphatase family protein n=1 Tax=Ferrovibrio sp. TaxID=1917215 RepID=UPI002625171A|nr:histidine phosphatase family protein [Ferrovibrio sp.]
MARLYLVRHAKAAARFDEDPDPSLSDEGKEAAVDLALQLEGLGPIPIYTSPMERARETALPLANRWGVIPEVSAAFSEIPTPPEIAQQGIKARGPWLQQLAGQRYPAQPPIIRAWREGLIGMLKSCRSDTIVFTHFMVINAALSAALNDDRMVTSHPDFCSCTVVESTSRGLNLLSRGPEAATKVL